MASGYYDITNKTLGKGHYGVVKLGRHCLTGEPVAIKIIEKSRLNHDSLNQLGTEIRILFRLSEYEHPNILKLYQTIDTEDKLFLVTEYCGPHACDLHDYLSKKHCRDGLNEREAQIFFIQICSAISYCHSMGIVHRDLKPENILVTDYKHMYATGSNEVNNKIQGPNELQYPLLKLIDFGFANQWQPDEKMRTSCGTLAYSAPELLLGEPYDGTKVDVWGLGLMLYILLYGGNPFMQINDNETLTRILDCSFATPSRDNVDCNAIELLRSLIRRNPERRLALESIFRHKWFSNLPETFDLIHKFRVKTSDQSSNAKLSKLLLQVASSTLPSISESGPLKNLNRSVDDDQLPTVPKEFSESLKTNYTRTRSLSITRPSNKIAQHQSLPQTRSSINLERLSQTPGINQPTSPFSLRALPIYRPTSPDVGGPVLPTEEENQLHDRVIQEMFRLTKFIDSKSSIEVALKNARTAHRQFNQNSIQPVQFGKRKMPTSIARSLLNTNKLGREEDEKSSSDKLSLINAKLSNDDYIYATYQLTRDKILRVKKERIKKQISTDQHERVNQNRADMTPGSPRVIQIEDTNLTPNQDTQEVGSRGVMGRSSAKENDVTRMQQQRKLLQPQHRMRDKFTSFFRSGSTSPSGSFSTSGDSQPSGETQTTNQTTPNDTHHEAFNDHNNEMSGSSSRFFGVKTDSQENSMAYALPLARKCSLVSEESGCSNDIPDS